MKKFIIVLLVLAVCGVAIYFAYPEISKMINGGQNTTSSVTDSSAKVSSANSSDTTESSSDAQTSDVSSEGGNPGNPDKYAMEIKKNMEDMKKGRITPSWIDSLKENEIFVFGSNLAGMHGGGAARIARLHFGAVMGKGVGLQGQSYAIPTMQGGVETIRPYVEEFLDFANHHSELHFLVTPIGCGIAGFEAEDIAPLFESAKEMKNISLPESFWEVIE